MKIVGKKSLSSGVYYLLWVLLPLGILCLLASAVWAGMSFSHLFSQQGAVPWTADPFPLAVIVGLAWLSGICCCLLLWQLIGIFRRLREGDCFSWENTRPLRRCAWCLWGIGLCFLGICGALFFDAGMRAAFTFFLSLLGAVAFLLLGCGVRILSELYRRAVEYKQENDLTI